MKKIKYNKDGVSAHKSIDALEHYKNKYNSGKVNYSNSSIGVDTKAGRFGVDKKGNASYDYTTKGGTKISARGNKRGGSVNIFKEL